MNQTTKDKESVVPGKFLPHILQESLFISIILVTTVERKR